MEHFWKKNNETIEIEYRWKNSEWNSIKVIADNKLIDLKTGSEEEFISEHYWGYTRISENITSEYEVEHPKWKFYNVNNYTIKTDFEETYSKDFNFLNNTVPKSVFLAEGSEISVKEGKKL
jgi:hypothetical protein